MDSFRKRAAAALALLSAAYILGAFLDPPALRPLMKLSCHRIPDRSFHFIWGVGGQCARCTGFWAGTLVMAVILFLRRPPGNIVIGLLLLLPMALDGTYQYFWPYQSTNLLRILTGAAAGTGLAMILGKAVED